MVIQKVVIEIEDGMDFHCPVCGHRALAWSSNEDVERYRPTGCPHLLFVALERHISDDWHREGGVDDYLLADLWTYTLVREDVSEMLHQWYEDTIPTDEREDNWSVLDPASLEEVLDEDEASLLNYDEYADQEIRKLRQVLKRRDVLLAPYTREFEDLFTRHFEFALDDTVLFFDISVVEGHSSVDWSRGVYVGVHFRRD